MKEVGKHRAADPSPAPAAALIGDPVRAAMLCALLDRGELAAGELAYRAGVAPNAASAHLAKLLAGRLITVRSVGRRRLFTLAGADVARALEVLSVLGPTVRIVALSQSRIAADLQAARSCYDHLAGRLGVALTEALVDRAMLVPARESAYRLTDSGVAFCTGLNIDVESRTLNGVSLPFNARIGASGGHMWPDRSAPHCAPHSLTMAGLNASRAGARSASRLPAGDGCA